MADKKAWENRNFYKQKISQIENEKSFKQFLLYELSELSNALASAHEKFEL